MKKTQKSTHTEESSKVNTDIQLTFDGNKVSGAWFHPELVDLICALCGKNCEIPCHNVNPYCG